MATRFLKTAPLTTLALVLALAACTPPETGTGTTKPAAEPAVAEPAAASDATPIDAATLAAQYWHLDTATDASGQRIDALFPSPGQPLTLTFEDGRLGVSGGCNRIGGDYRIDAQGRLQAGKLVSTMMACEDALMQADRAIMALLEQPLAARIDHGEPARLILQAADGATSAWIGEPTAQTRYGVPGETVFLEVASQRVDCEDPGKPGQRCLRVREVVYGDDGVRERHGDWQPLHPQIEGFEFREGERSVLRLKRFERTDAAVDEGAVAYVLDMVVESEQVAPAR